MHGLSTLIGSGRWDGYNNSIVLPAWYLNLCTDMAYLMLLRRNVASEGLSLGATRISSPSVLSYTFLQRGTITPPSSIISHG